MNVIIVEDDDQAFLNLRSALSVLKSAVIQRASHWHEALKLVRECERNTLWIVDGIFPMYKGEGMRVLGPDVVRRIRLIREKRSEMVIGFTSDPKIFTNEPVRIQPDHIFSKGEFDTATEKMVEIIQDLSVLRDVP